MNSESEQRPTAETLITPSNNDVAVNTILDKKTVNLSNEDDNLPEGFKKSSISHNVLHLESYKFYPYYCGFQGTLSSAGLKNYREVVVFFCDPKINRYTAKIRKNFTMNKLENITFEKIVVSPTGQRGKSDVVLHGALASILAYANNTAQSGVVSSGVGRVLLVAGVGFEPTTFRL